MSKRIDIARFEALVEHANKVNAKAPGKRFVPIQSREGKILRFGMYDTKRHKYVLSEPFVDVNLAFDEIDVMLANAHKT